MRLACLYLADFKEQISVREGRQPVSRIAARGLIREALVEAAAAVAPLSPQVELVEPAALRCRLYLEVPTGQRPARFARKILTALAGLELTGRVGVAEDRFTAWAAAARGRDSITIVPRGEAAAFLAPLPLDLLPLAAEVRAMLRAAGVRTLGEFAALPPPSVLPAAGAVDYHELAWGRGPCAIQPTAIRSHIGTRRAPMLRLDSATPTSAAAAGG